LLEPDILIVDEVLAVGDAEFQKKAIGKMKDISSGDNGRTVLFVSHNMAAVQNLCPKSILLENGKIIFNGETNDVITHYLSSQNRNFTKLSEIENRQGNGSLLFKEGNIKGIETQNGIIETFKDVALDLEYDLNIEKVLNFRIDIGINNYLGDRVAWVSSQTLPTNFDIKNKKISFVIFNLPLAPGDYNLNIFCEINNEIADWITGVLPFTVAEKDYYGSGKVVPANQGSVLLNFKIN